MQCAWASVKPLSVPGMQAGMVSINDFAATYMCQSLPFGGVKESGFGRFAGVEGLRSLCHPVAMCQDRCACASMRFCLCCWGCTACMLITSQPMTSPSSRLFCILGLRAC